jgi:hypothetical protein
MNMNIISLYYKESSKEPAVHEALIDISQVSMIVRIGQNTVGLVVPGGWYEYALASDRVNGIELLNKSADKYIELTNAWRKTHEFESSKKITRREKASMPFAPPIDTPTPETPRKTLTAMADQLLKNGVAAKVSAPLLTPVPPAAPAPAVRQPVAEMPPRPVGFTSHPFRDPSGLPTMIDLRDVSTISGFSDGSNKVRLGLHRGGARTVFMILQDGQNFDEEYTNLYHRWYGMNFS